MAPIREMLSDTGLTEQQWRVLRVLSEHGALDSSTLADRASLLHPSLTRMIPGMCTKKLLTQTRSTQDLRRVVIEITPTGQAVIDDNMEQATAIAEGYKTKLGAERFEMLLDLLAELDPHAGK